MHQTTLTSLLLAALLAATGACGPTRTAAATQPTPAAFDPSQSDDKALAAVDTMLQALGGADTWAQVKELRWETKYYNDGKLEAWLKHSWDMWNGRHRYERPNMTTYEEAQDSGRPEDIKWFRAMYDLFDRESGGYASYDGVDIVSTDAQGLIEEAYEKWRQDSYLLTMIYKLRDPGVKLSYVGEVKDVQGTCMNGCIELKVTYEPTVGTDTWFVDIDKTTNLPQVLGKKVEGGRIGFAITEWAEDGGLKLPGKIQVLGASQAIDIENLSVHDKPDDAQYVPAVR